MKDERSIDVRRVGKVEKYKMKEDKGVKNMENKRIKELIRSIETKKLLLIENVVRWTQSLSPVKDVHVKIKGRYYPLIERETGKLYVIDKMQGRKVSFSYLDQSMKFVIASVVAEKKEQIEKEVEEDKRKYLEKKLQEVDDLLNKFF